MNQLLMAHLQSLFHIDRSKLFIVSAVLGQRIDVSRLMGIAYLAALRGSTRQHLILAFENLLSCLYLVLEVVNSKNLGRYHY